MNKNIKAIAAALVIAVIVMSTGAVFAAANVIKINGVAAEIPEGMGQIREKDDRTFVPLRFVSEFLEYQVWYMDETKTAGIESADNLLFVQDGNIYLTSVSKETGETSNIEMDTSAYIEPTEDRMYLPIRFLAEAMGYTVGWDEVTETVTLDKK